ncbi:Hpt domain-containing protein [Pseudomonas knackmussii]|uniref:Hpt domain-containing protein n=1 Tax=Pseudomonas knackmussii TaxID=65741 RepID=UPI003BD2ECFE
MRLRADRLARGMPAGNLAVLLPLCAGAAFALAHVPSVLIPVLPWQPLSDAALVISALALLWRRRQPQCEATRRRPSVCDAGFDLDYLSGLNANPHWLAQLLGALRHNLIEERQRLQSSSEWHEPLQQALHRLSGLACTIDAPGLLRACQDVEQALECDPAGIGEHLESLRACLGALLDDVERRLADPL